jgi:O-methyltransferase involved in polyketide biosynthesis
MLVDTAHSQSGRRVSVPVLPTGVGLTALCTASERGAENRRPDRLFEDPIARVLTEVISSSPTTGGLRDGHPVGNRALVRDFVALRTRFFDD